MQSSGTGLERGQSLEESNPIATLVIQNFWLEPKLKEWNSFLPWVKPASFLTSQNFKKLLNHLSHSQPRVHHFPGWTGVVPKHLGKICSTRNPSEFSSCWFQMGIMPFNPANAVEHHLYQHGSFFIGCTHIPSLPLGSDECQLLSHLLLQWPWWCHPQCSTPAWRWGVIKSFCREAAGSTYLISNHEVRSSVITCSIWEHNRQVSVSFGQAFCEVRGSRSHFYTVRKKY